ncbi:MAG: hemerythrin domain-containing protein [Proteobacteria bacterium]|nr:hemerythrin domain-containing protein [Pseudomonadota bacterium]
MSPNQPSALLEQQHRRIDDGIEAALQGAAPRAVLVEALQRLREHIHLEEAVLFPPLERAGLTMPIFVMQREHGQMWPLIETLAAAGGEGEVQDAGRELFQMLQIHNPKEEQILYKAADQVDEARNDGALLRALQAARMPEGWACAMAPR